jgi:signal transduction histidine kinase
MNDITASLEASLLEAGSPEAKVNGLNALAWETRRRDIDEAVRLAKQAYAIACISDANDKPQYMVGAADSLANLTIFYQIQGNYQEGLAAGFEAASLCESIGYPAGLGKVYRGLGNICTMLGNYAEALKYQMQGLEICESVGEPFELVFALNATGSAYSYTGDYLKALEFYARSMTILETHDDPRLRGQIHNNTAMEYLRLRDHMRALVEASTSQQIYHDLGDAAGELNALGTVAEIYIELGEPDQALAALNQQLALAKSAGYRWHTVLAHRLKGRAYHHKNLFDEAITELESGLTLADEMHAKGLLYECHSELADVLEKQGRYQEALSHHRQYHTLYQQVLGEENARNVMGLRNTYELQAVRREKERIEALREQDRQYFEHLSRMKNDLVSTASHDLKNPLTNIVLYIHLLRSHENLGESTADEYLGMMMRQAERMQDLISNVLDLAQLETGRALVTERRSINDLVRDAVLDFVLRASSKDITLNFTPCRNDPQIPIDSSQLRRALDNLISNAIKYTPADGQVRVRVDSTDTAVLIHVQDTGIGIPQDDIDHIFDPFYRISDKQHLSVEGTGLGLAITRSIVEQHNGSISVTSESGTGTEFTVSLPIMAEDGGEPV